MRVLVTAGPTREYLDPVRFLTNASSGRMGYAVARKALEAGCQVRLLSGPVSLELPSGAQFEKFVSVADLQARLRESFEWCDALVMTAAVGDFTVQTPADRKLSRKAGPVEVRLVPTDDVVASVACGKRPDQRVVVFAVEDLSEPEAQAKAREEMAAKNADWVVLNPPQAMDSPASRACILGSGGVVLDWGLREKDELAGRIVRLLLDSKPSRS